MKVLYITSRPPYPPHRGDQLIAYEQIKNLAGKDYEIHLVSFIESKEDIETVNYRLKKYCKKIYYIKLNKYISVFTSFKTILNKKPFQVNKYTDFLTRKRVNDLLRYIKPDIIHVQTIRLADLFLHSSTPKVLDMIDVMSLNMKRRSVKEKFYLQSLFKLEAYLLKEYEIKVINKYSKVSLVSENDLLNSPQLMNNRNIRINPNGTSMTNSSALHIKSTVRENIIIFHGNMSYFPNIEAMQYFIKNVWNSILAKYPDYKLYVVGRDPDESLKKYNGNNNIIVTGYVDNMAYYLFKAKIGIYPLNAGTGMQNKILESLACDLPTIASSYAVQGIRGITSDEVLIANSKEEYIKAIITMIENVSIRKKYIENGKKFISSNYSWNNNVNTLKEIWNQAVCENNNFLEKI